MGVRDFLYLTAICLVWGLNVVVTRWVVGEMGVPPLFFAGVRFALIGLVVAPLLWPVPKAWGLLILVALSMGAAQFGFLFLGLREADASAAAVVGQLGAPFSTLLSMLFLHERIHWRRGLGIALAFAGVVVIAFDPHAFGFSTGLVLVAVSAFFGSVGTIWMKRLPGMSALRLQAWTGAVSFAPLFALSALTEPGAAQSYAAGGWPVWLATGFAVLGVSLFGHGGFYTLVKRHEISLLAPLTLMTPLWGVLFGIVLLGEPASPKLFVGGTIALAGVLIIALRPNRALPEARLGDKLTTPT